MTTTRRTAPAEVFAVSTTTAQIVVRGVTHADSVEVLDDSGVRQASAGRIHDVARFGRVRGTRRAGTDPVAAVDATGLAAGHHYHLRIAGRHAGEFTTLQRPGGALVGRVATISDLHVGQRVYSHLPAVKALPATGPCDHRIGAAMMCLAAAVDEINAWAPDLVVVKGDLAHHNAADEYDLVFAEIGRLGAPLLVIPGNHDGGDYIDSDVIAAAARHGVAMQPVATTTVGSWSVVAASSVDHGRQAGTLTPVVDRIIAEAAASAGPCLVALHHQLMWSPIQHYVPRGVDHRASLDLCERLRVVNPRSVITAGHTHRNRAHHHAGVVATEVGSTKDFPGVWAGYELHESGFTQVVRRIAEPGAFAWAERTRHAALGAWERWASGTLADRCFSHTWS